MIAKKTAKLDDLDRVHFLKWGAQNRYLEKSFEVYLWHLDTVKEEFRGISHFVL